MLCEICNINQVSFVISISTDSSIKDIRVCEDCATGNPKHKASDINDELKIDSRKCSKCSFSYLQTRCDPNGDDIPLLGCPDCYIEFHEELMPLLRKLHGDIIHTGKQYMRKQAIEKIWNGSKGFKERKNNNFRSVVRGEARAEAEWMQGNGPESDVVISTRVRLARNISGYLFSNMAAVSELNNIAVMVEDVVSKLAKSGNVPLRNASIIKLENLDEIDREFLIERHLISRDLIKQNGAGEAIVGEKEVVSIMLNEEDHIRLQVINSGLQTRQSWDLVNSIDNELGNQLPFAYSPSLGYLTACSTNVGTGLRVSVMFHIPALAATSGGKKILSSISDMGYTIRGMYGEGSRATGAFYQVSNEATLGQTEEEIIDHIQSIARQIIERERHERRVLIEKSGINLEDRVFRSYGTLLNSRTISSKEAQSLLSWVSLGISIGILSEVSKSDIARLLVLTRPAHLQKYEGVSLDAVARDISRAGVIRTTLSDN